VERLDVIEYRPFPLGLVQLLSVRLARPVEPVFEAAVVIEIGSPPRPRETSRDRRR
jgi:hypothetical protein